MEYISELPSLLQWKNFDQFNHLSDLRNTFFLVLLKDKLQKECDELEFLSIQDNPFFKSVINSPYLISSLISNHGEIIENYKSLVSNDIYMEQLIFRNETNKFLINSVGESMDNLENLDDLGTWRGQCFRSHLGFILDFGSSKFYKNQHGNQYLVNYRYADSILLINKFSSDFSNLEAIDNQIANVIKEFVKLIVFHKEPRSSKAFSGSWRGYIGKIGLVNFKKMKVQDTIDALVHEAIHSILYSIELFNPLFANEIGLKPVQLKSPWSGNDIRLSSFIHACFVWYGLFYFWSLALERKSLCTISEDVIIKFRNRAQNGFTKFSLSNILKPFVYKETYDCISLIQNNVAEISYNIRQ